MLFRSLGMILSTLACLGLLAGETTGLFHVGVWTLAIPAVYLLWIYLLRVRARVDLKLPPIGVETMEVDSRGTGRLWLLFAASALLLIAAASLLSYSAKTIADLSGLGETVIGTTLVALVTSAPELITCLAAIRIGSVDLAVGNALGSNIFNMNILFFADIAYRRSPILTAASPIHSKTALVGIFLSGLVALGMVTPIPGRIGRFTVESILLLLAYMGFSAYLLTQV